MAQVAQTRGQSKASASQEPPRREPEPERRKETVEVEEDDDEDEQDDRMRQEEDRRAEQRANKRGAYEEAEPVLHDAAPKKKKYEARLEEGFDVEKVIDRLFEGHNDLMTLRWIQDLQRLDVVTGNFDQMGSLNPAEREGIVPESQDDEFEEGEIKKEFRAEEYDGIYLELRLLLSCEMRDRDASERAQKMRHLYTVRDGHLFVKRQVENPRRVVCGRNRSIDVIAGLHDDIAGGHRGVNTMYAKISELYYWDEMIEMIIKFCRSRVPCQERSPQRPGEPLHPRLEREVGTEEHLDLLFMPIGDHGYNYIFDAQDNLTGFVDGRAIRTKTGSVLVSCIEEYYLRYPFVREFMMDRGSEFTCQEVQELLSRWDVYERLHWKLGISYYCTIHSCKSRGLGSSIMYAMSRFRQKKSWKSWKDWVSGSRLKKFVAREEVR
ncbi:hypothetical protein CBR_g48245 [Chara braunii]|uniref:Integrase zinc-binding domain-containing protein n=1 Tax=Chara braunii TaxID=69332 RepID=A0A388M2F2_CHABU|nr:hypothetical protein CBR_g48245 [Chara braunii]|eukprot:GBG88716.1 hypothetical protein CBR_g48245 [Chara braunii]